MISLAPALLNLPSLPLSLIRIDAQYSRFLLLLLLFFISFLNGSNTGFVDITTSPYVLSFQLLYSCTYIRSLFHLIYCAYLEWVFWADLTAHYLIISSLMFFFYNFGEQFNSYDVCYSRYDDKYTIRVDGLIYSKWVGSAVNHYATMTIIGMQFTVQWPHATVQ